MPFHKYVVVFGACTATLASRSLAQSPTLRADTVRANPVAPAAGYAAFRSRTATKTDTPLRDVPQAISVVTRALMQDQAMRGIGDVVRYLPGVGMSQGEGNRDAPVLRGNTSTGDLFVDGLRDDVQYFRDLYNTERVEAIKGPNAMIFGRGGAGGILNRVTKQASWSPIRALELQGGAWNERRITGDMGGAITPTLAARVAGVLEQDDSYRTGVSARREGIAPTLSWQAGAQTLWRFGFEHFRDTRTADRGLPSYEGAPLALNEGTVGQFFGDPTRSQSLVTARLGTLALSHRWTDGAQLDSRLLIAHYDKFYSNIFPSSAVNALAGTVQLSGYTNATARDNVIWQSDLQWVTTTGPVAHRMLAGIELVRQATDNLRETAYFNGSTTALSVPVSSPTSTTPVTWRPSATDASNTGLAQTAAVYLQDQMILTSWLQAIAGVRADRFQLNVTNRRTGDHMVSRNRPLSPRLGLVVKPADAISAYASWSQSFVPRGGDQLASLTLSNQALEPESFVNQEIGAKWDVRPTLSVALAGYQLNRRNVLVPDPLDVTRTVLANAQRTRGFEASIDGQLFPGWHIAGGYAQTDGRFTQALNAATPAGATVANLPRHTFSLWQRVNVHSHIGLGVGLQQHSAMYAATDNSVRIPGFARLDGALYLRLSPTWSSQVNIDNVLNRRYIVSANGNNNLMPAAPRLVRVVLRATY